MSLNNELIEELASFYEPAVDQQHLCMA